MSNKKSIAALLLASLLAGCGGSSSSSGEIDGGGNDGNTAITGNTSNTDNIGNTDNTVNTDNISGIEDAGNNDAGNGVDNSTFPKLVDGSLESANGLVTIKANLIDDVRNYEYSGVLWGERLYVFSSKDTYEPTMNLTFATVSSKNSFCNMTANFSNALNTQSLLKDGSGFTSNSSCFKPQSTSTRIRFNGENYYGRNTHFYGKGIRGVEIKTSGNVIYHREYPEGIDINHSEWSEINGGSEFTVRAESEGYSLSGVHAVTGCKLDAQLTELSNFVFYIAGNATACIDGENEGAFDGIVAYEVDKYDRDSGGTTSYIEGGFTLSAGISSTPHHSIRLVKR